MTQPNREIVVFASEARVASVNSEEFDNYEGRGLILQIDVTAIAATPSVVPTIQGKDPASGKWYDILAGAALVAVATVELRVYPGLTAVANLVASDVLPKSWRLEMVHADADSITYSVGASVIV
jgi:hypothetical protein